MFGKQLESIYNLQAHCPIPNLKIHVISLLYPIAPRHVKGFNRGQIGVNGRSTLAGEQVPSSAHPPHIRIHRPQIADKPQPIANNCDRFANPAFF